MLRMLRVQWETQRQYCMRTTCPNNMVSDVRHSLMIIYWRNLTSVFAFSEQFLCVYGWMVFGSRPMCFGCAEAKTFRPELYKGTKILINLIKIYENDSVLNMDFHTRDIRLHLRTHILQTIL